MSYVDNAMHTAGQHGPEPHLRLIDCRALARWTPDDRDWRDVVAESEAELAAEEIEATRATWVEDDEPYTDQVETYDANGEHVGYLRFRRSGGTKRVGGAEDHAVVFLATECVFRPKPITDSGPSRSPIPAHADHRFRPCRSPLPGLGEAGVMPSELDRAG